MRNVRFTHSTPVLALLLGLLLMAACGDGKQQHSDTEAQPPDLSGSMLELTEETIDAFVDAGGLMLLEFGGKRCISCLHMRENLEELQTRMPALRIGFVYWEDSPELFESWAIELVPAQIILDTHGQVVLRHRGVWSVAEMEEALAVL
jgi:hypothetical protein